MEEKLYTEQEVIEHMIRAVKTYKDGITLGRKEGAVIGIVIGVVLVASIEIGNAISRMKAKKEAEA
ncbi:MAG: hypothetical protein K0R00_46 [Herbinix sp.]|nr:hypothetical protein [Herbinix sp.]